MEAMRGQTIGPGRNDDPREVHTLAWQQEDTKSKDTEPKDMESKDTGPSGTVTHRPDHKASEYQAVLLVASSHASAMLPNLAQLTTLEPSMGSPPLFFK